MDEDKDEGINTQVIETIYLEVTDAVSKLTGIPASYIREENHEK